VPVPARLSESALASTSAPVPVCVILAVPRPSSWPEMPSVVSFGLLETTLRVTLGLPVPVLTTSTALLAPL
jgi:hypothetical protein